MKNNPFDECEKCKNIEDCKHPEVDMFGSPIPPENICPQPITILEKIYNKKRNARLTDRISKEIRN
jgi:hypothetical protein